MYDMANLKKLKTLGKGAPAAMDAFGRSIKRQWLMVLCRRNIRELIASRCVDDAMSLLPGDTSR